MKRAHMRRVYILQSANERWRKETTSWFHVLHDVFEIPFHRRVMSDMKSPVELEGIDRRPEFRWCLYLEAPDSVRDVLMEGGFRCQYPSWQSSHEHSFIVREEMRDGFVD